MSLVTANNVRRGHKAGHYLLILYDRPCFLYQYYVRGYGETVCYLRKMTQEEFTTIGCALWEYGKKRGKMFGQGA